MCIDIDSVLISFSYHTVYKHANYYPLRPYTYEVYCFLVNILGKEHYSNVSLGPNYACYILSCKSTRGIKHSSLILLNLCATTDVLHIKLHSTL